MRRAPVLASALVLILSIISFVFVVVATTSPKWSKREYYYSAGGLIGIKSDQQPLCSASRSPFYRCSYPQVPTQVDGEAATCVAPVCVWYKPYGRDATSCRTPAEMNLDPDDIVQSLGLFGTVQECQQVHYAGNLQIAAVVFIGIGLLLSLLTGLLVFTSRASHKPTHHQHEANDEYKGPSSHNNTMSKKSTTTLPISYVVLALSASLCIGAVLQILAQCFGVLGLTLTASPSAAEATVAVKPDTENYRATEWTIDQALSEFTTVAWTSAIAAAVLASVVFGRSRASW